MPTVPRYGPLNIATRPLPGVRRSAGATELSSGAALHGTEAAAARRRGQAGVQQAEALGTIGQGATQLGLTVAREELAERQEAKDFADNLHDVETQNQLATIKTTLLHHPETGALNTTGPATLGKTRETLDAYDEQAAAVGAGLTTPRQRFVFARARAGGRLEIQGTLEAHAQSEMRRWGQAELGAFVANQQREAISVAPRLAQPGQDEAARVQITAALNAASEQIQVLGPPLGMGPAAVTKAVAATRSAIHTGVVEALLADEQTSQAQIYFEHARAQIDPDAATQLEKALRVGTIRAEAQDATATILAEPGLTRTEQLAKADALANREVRDETKRRLEHEHARQDAEQRRQEAADVDRAYTLVDQGRPLPADLESRLGSALPGLRSFAQQRARGDPIPTNLSAWYDLWTMSAEDPETFIGLKLPTYTSQISEQDLMELTKLQVSMKRGDKAAANTALAGFRTHKEIVEDTLFQYTQTADKDYTKAQTAAKANLMRQLDLWQASEQASGRKVTNEQVQRRVDEILSHKATKPGSWWALWSPYQYDVRDQPGRFLIDFTYSDISAEERRTLEAALQAKGRAVTPATVLDLYIQIHTQGRAK